MRSLLLITAFVFMTACGNKQKQAPAKPAPEPPTPTESKAAPEPAHDDAAEKPTKAMGAQVEDNDDDADDKAKR